MADDTDDKTEDPTQKRLDDAHAKGDVVKSQEVNTWFIIAGATLVLSTFSGSVGGGILTPLRNLIANAGQLRADGAALLAARQYAGLCRARRHRRAAVDADACRDRRQHDPAPPGLVVGIVDAEIQQGIARRRTEAHLRQAGGGEFRSRACSSWSRLAPS